jgi:hypothetical protein
MPLSWPFQIAPTRLACPLSRAMPLAAAPGHPFRVCMHAPCTSFTADRLPVTCFLHPACTVLFLSPSVGFDSLLVFGQLHAFGHLSPCRSTSSQARPHARCMVPIVCHRATGCLPPPHARHRSAPSCFAQLADPLLLESRIVVNVLAAIFDRQHWGHRLMDLRPRLVFVKGYEGF